jgi:hypothetical protein
MNPLFWSLLAGIIFCIVAWRIGPRRCSFCGGRGTYEVIEHLTPELEIRRDVRCPDSSCQATRKMARL